MEAQDSHQLKMEYFDYGTVSLHTQDQLYTLVPDLQPHKYPRMSRKARLYGVQRINPRRWGRQTSDTFQSLVGGGLVDRDVDVTTRLVRQDGDLWSVTLEVEEEESGEMVDVGEKLASLGLVLLEFKVGNPPKKLDSYNDLLLLEKLPSFLQQKEVMLEPNILEEISMEHQAMSDLIKEDHMDQVPLRQKVLAQKVLSTARSAIMLLEDSEEKREILSLWTQ